MANRTSAGERNLSAGAIFAVIAVVVLVIVALAYRSFGPSSQNNHVTFINPSAANSYAAHYGAPGSKPGAASNK